MEVLMFLLFLAVYGLVSCFSRDRILRLVRVIAQQKQAPEIFKALGFADKDLAPGKFTDSSLLTNIAIWSQIDFLRNQYFYLCSLK
jgi:hypothetical protein